MKGCGFVGVALVVIISVGCGPTASRKTDAVSKEPSDPVAAYVERVEQALSQNDTSNAVALLEQGIAEVPAESRGRLFSFLLAILIDQGLLDEAQARFVQLLESGDAELARESFGLIEEALAREEGGHERVLAWCDRLEGVPGAKAVAANLLRNRLTALHSLKRYEEALETLMRRWDDVGTDEAVGRWSWLVQTAMNEGRTDVVERALAEVENRESPAALRRAAAGAQIELAIHRRLFQAAAEQTMALADRLDDAALTRVVDQFGRATHDAAAGEAADGFMEQILSQPAFRDRANARRRAVRWYVNRARDAKDLAEGIRRLRRLEEWQVSPPFLLGGLLQLSDLTLAPETPDAAVQEAFAFAHALRPRLKDDNERAQLAGMILDAGFRIEAYDRLESLLAEGIPGNDPAWHETMLNKVRAHAALKRGDTDEAIRRFRAFMTAIEAQPDAGHRDPVTDERITKEMILGYNAKRIAGLLEQAGRAAEAAAARQEAIRYYQKALESFKPEDAEYTTIQKALAELSQG